MSLCCFCCSADCIKNLAFSLTKLLFDSVNIFKSLKLLKKIISLSFIASRYLIIICIYYRIYLLDFSVLYSYLNDILTSLKLISAPCSCSIPFTVHIFALACSCFHKLKAYPYIAAAFMECSIVGKVHCKYRVFLSYLALK